MFTLSRNVTAGIAAMLMLAGAAQAATIDFTGTVDSDFDPGETYTEDGFTFEVLSGVEFAIYNFGPSLAFGALLVGDDTPIGIGDTISITADSGRLFTFDSVDFSSANQGRDQSDGVDLVGLRNGATVATFSNLNKCCQNGFLTLSDAFTGAIIDELWIIGASQGDDLLVLDNFVFTEVPLPAAAWVFLAGIAGLTAARRKQCAQAA